MTSITKHTKQVISAFEPPKLKEVQKPDAKPQEMPWRKTAQDNSSSLTNSLPVSNRFDSFVR